MTPTFAAQPTSNSDDATNDRPVQPFVRNVAVALLSQPPVGALTLVNGRQFQQSGWPELGRALNQATTQRDHDLAYCQLGDRPPHELTRHLDGEYLMAVADFDRDLEVQTPDWESDEYDTFYADPLATRLSPFGSNSIPALARILAAEEH